MASPFVRVDADGRIRADSEKQATDLSAYFDVLQNGTISATAELDTHANATLTGSLGSETEDVIAVELVAGQTYTFSYRGTVEGGIQDPYLALFDTAFGYITEDDDGGLGRTSQITYTAASTGTYYLYATSWYHIDPSAPGYPDYRDSGDYTINIWSPDPAHDAPGTLAGAVEIDVGTTYGYLDSTADLDMYKIEATEGMVYTVTYAGGISGSADWDDEPGENIGVLRLYDENGTPISAVVNYETGLSFVAEESGTYYVRAESYAGTTGGYTLDVAARALADYDPLESLNWDSANNVPFVEVDGVPTAYVYFAPAGENFGETEPNSTAPMATYGWEQFQIDGVMQALEEYEHILGVNYEITTDVNQATFRLVTTENQVFGARFYPQDPAYGDAQGIGFFNLLSGRFTDPASLQPGGFSYAVVLHEFGHAHGVAHPHDTGGGSEVMLGVAGSDSLGIYDLNQGVYTVMSYNDGWVTHPDGERVFASTTFQAGWSATLGAFDIAVLQARYGVHDYNTGNDVYVLADTQDAASYKTIWDTGGSDTISYSGDRDVHIDLLAATLDYTPTGGGVVSFADGIFGGYTIANGVTIENATGGNGDDVLIGNAAANALKGNGGDDLLMGREGGDTLDGGAGFDTVSYRLAEGGVTATLVVNRGLTGEAKGDKYISIEKLEGSEHGDLLTGKLVGDSDVSGFGGNDGIYGGFGDNVLDGGEGDDLIYADSGDDTVSGGAGDDKLWGGNHDDVMDGGDGDDRLDGGNHADQLTGGAGDDQLFGDNHNDRLNGGAGDDTLSGGNHNDVFAFTDLGGDDVITDFRRGQDKIDLSGLDAVAGGGDDAFSWVGSSAFSNTAGELRSYSQGGNRFLAGDVDGDGVADFTIQTNLPIIVSDVIL